MKNYNWLYLSLSILIISCSGETEEVFNRTQIDVPIEEEVVLEEEASTETSSHDDVLKGAANFFEWYKLNRSKFYELQASCVIVENEYYQVDSVGVQNYALFLAESGHFSDLYIKRMKNEWFDNCGREMIVDRENGVKADGPPMCVYEGDIFFLVQEEPTDASFESLDFKVIKNEHGGVVVHTGITSISFVNENGIWKLLTLS